VTVQDPKHGVWFTTASGQRFYPWRPGASPIEVGDIAATLAKINRWGGHTRQPYSVAQHSWLVAHYVPTAKQAWGLMHDATEAYMGGDIVSPIKKQIPELQYMEAGIAAAVEQRFGFPAGALEDPDVKHADLLVLAWEFRDLMPSMRDPETGQPGWVPMPMAAYAHLIPAERLQPWGWQEAEAAFLVLAARLGLHT
jgi:hypothetical protein